VIVAGFGFRGAASLASLQSALMRAQQGHPRVTMLAAPQDKAPALAPFAALMNLPVIGIDAGALEAIATPTTSLASLARRNSGSVAEASALAAAGPDARLIATRHISIDRMATCAIAKGHPQ
jgi:cobalt-precorrin 5A hydrolase